MKIRTKINKAEKDIKIEKNKDKAGFLKSLIKSINCEIS